MAKIIQYTLLTSVLILFSLFSWFDYNGNVYLYAPFILLLLIYLNIRKGQYIFNLLNIFNISSLLFFFSAPIMSLLLNIDLYLLESLVVANFKPRDLDLCSLIILISIIIINISYSSKIRLFNSNLNLKLSKYNNTYFRIGKYFMILSSPLMLLLIFFQIKFILENGYLSLYNGEIDKIEYPLPFLNYVTYIFYFGYYFICASKCDRKYFNFFSVLYICFSIFDSFKGGRLSLVISILFYLWFSYEIYGISYKLKKFLIPLGILLLFLNFITFNRESDIDNKTTNNLITATGSIIASQGRSTQLFSLYLENKDEIHHYGKYMILSNLSWPYLILKYPSSTFKSQNIQAISVSNNFKDIITYVINPDYYLSGGGMGGTYIVEIYEIGILFTILYSIILGTFLFYFRKWVKVYPFAGFIAFFIFQFVFIMPRAEALPNLLTLIKLTFVFSAITYLFNKSKNVKILRQ